MVTKVYTGRIPHDGLQNDVQVLLAVTKGIRPERPGSETGIFDELWELVSRCWQQDPGSRPTMQGVVETVRLTPDSRYLDGTNIS
jgi:hypothetical protein